MTMSMLRSLCALAAAAALVVPAGQGLLAQDATAQTVYTLAPDEEILRPESTIMVSAEGADVVLVLSKGNGSAPSFFVFREGKKTGPYPDITGAMAAAYAGRKNAPGGSGDCAVYDPPDPPNGHPEPGPGAGGKQVVQFRGKSLGSHLMVFQALATPDGATAFYTAGDSDKSWFGCSDGRVVSFGGVPEDMKFSPDGKNGAVMVKGKLTMAQMGDLGKLPPEKLAAAMKDMDSVLLYTIDGRSFGPFNGDAFNPSSFWYPKSSNDLYYRLDDGVFRNGALMFKTPSFDRCGFYPSPDGKSYALYDYEKIVFSDGPSYPSPLDVAVFPRAGRTVFLWISLENEKKIMVYERQM